jgi:sugar lactone lactonase YvrE
MGSQSIFQPRPVVMLCLLTTLLASTAWAQTLATTVPLVLPSAITLDAQGNLYLAETANHVVRKVDSSGHITVVAGTGTQGYGGDGGPATAALLDSPQGLAVDARSLYIADTHNHRIRKVDLTSGTITTIAGNSSAASDGDAGLATAATLDAPTALALDNEGNIYLADVRSHRIRKISAAGFITTIAGTGAQGFDGDGAIAVASLLDSPEGLAIDSSGNLYIADSHNHRVRRIETSTGAITTVAGTGAAGFSGDSGSAVTAALSLPQGLTIDPQGNVYLADTANHRVRRIDATHGTISTIAGEGTQAFAGDGGPAAAANLDSPRSAVVSDAGSLVIADTGNRRIREIMSDASLQTVAGLGATSPGAIALSGATVVSYGAGHLVATLNSAIPATGSVTFLDSYGGASSTVATVSLVSSVASLDISSLSVGQHAITATYPGDLSHAAAQSTVFGLTVSPLPLTPVISPLSVTYGEPVPALTGTLNGVLSRDQANVSATFVSAASIMSPAGSYPVTVTLAGAAAPNYTVTDAPTFAITPAPTITTLTTNNAAQTPVSTVNAGDPVIFAAHVASQTSGLPTGVITVFDGGSVVTTGKTKSNGEFAFVTSNLTAGSHAFTASYLGDANFTASTSSAASLTVNGLQTAPVDFTFNATGSTTQTIVSGALASFTFSTQTQSGLSSPIALSASGLPNGAAASFNPAYIPPGSSNATVTLTIATPKTAGLESTSSVVAAFLFFPIGIVLLRPRIRPVSNLLAAILLAWPLLYSTGCGDRIYTERSVDASKSYTITVTGTSTSPNGTALKHTVTVMLIVLSAN